MDLKDVTLKLEKLDIQLTYIRDTLNALSDALNSEGGYSYTGCVELLYYVACNARNDCLNLYEGVQNEVYAESKGGTDNV